MSPGGADTSPAGGVDAPARSAPWAGVAVTAGLAAALAIGLGAVGLADASLWLDETFSVFDARRELVDILMMRGEAFGGAHHPPGYFLLLKGTIAVCGVHEACVRAPSVLAHAGIAAVLVVLAGRLFGRFPAAVAGLTWATLPYAIKYGQQARHYTLLALVAAVALMLLARALALVEPGRSPQRAPDRTFVQLGLASAAGLWLHLFALPFLGAMVVVALAMVLFTRDRTVLPTRRQWATTVAVAVVASAPLLPGLSRVWLTSGGGQLESKIGPVENARELLVDLATFGLDTPWIPILCACALLRPSWRARGQVLALAVLAVLPLSVVLVRNPEHFVTLRYFMPSLVAVALLFAAGVGAVADLVAAALRRSAPRHTAMLTPVLAAAVLAVPALQLARLQVAGLRKQWATAGFEPWRDVAAAIRGAAVDGDIAVYVPYELVQYPFAVYELATPAYAPNAETPNAETPNAETPNAETPNAETMAEALAQRPPGVFVVASHIDRAERSAERRAVLRALGSAGYARSELEGVPSQRAIEVLLYRRRR